MDVKELTVGWRATLRVRAAGFWSSDWSLTVLLALLIGNVFVVPLAEFATWGRLAARAIFSLIIVSGVIATVNHRRLIILATAVALGSLFVGWAEVRRPNPSLRLLNDLDSLLFIGFLVVVILRQVLRAGPINWHRVRGSIAVYLLLGILWAISYDLIELLQPGAFSMRAQTGGADLQQLGYLSFTTLTTLGLGDILPLTPLARSLVMLEALVGQLFPVILIARLVAMQIEYQSARLP